MRNGEGMLRETVLCGVLMGDKFLPLRCIGFLQRTDD